MPYNKGKWKVCKNCELFYGSGSIWTRVPAVLLDNVLDQVTLEWNFSHFVVIMHCYWNEKKKRWRQISEIVWKWLLFHGWIYLLSQKRISYYFSKFLQFLQTDNAALVHVSQVWKQFNTVILPPILRRNKNKQTVIFKFQTYLTLTSKNSGGHEKYRLIVWLSRIVSCSFFSKCHSFIF